MYNNRKEMQQKFTKLSSIVEDYATVYSRLEHFETLNNILTNELEESREQGKVLQEQLKKVLEINETNTNYEYAKLRESFAKIKQENVSLVETVRKMKDAHSVEAAGIKHALETQYSADTKQLVDKVRLMEEDAERNRIQYEKTEQSLRERLHMQQINAAVDNNEIESKYKASIVQLNHELRVANQTCSSLRTEIFHLKHQLRLNIGDVPDKRSDGSVEQLKVAEKLKEVSAQKSALEEKLHSTEALLKESQEQLVRANTLNEMSAATNINRQLDLNQKVQSTDRIRNGDSFKPATTDIAKSNNNQTGDYNLLVEQAAPSTRPIRNVPIYKTRSRGAGYKNRGSRVSLPTLKPVANVATGSNTTTLRKRKLYDLNNLDHCDMCE